MNQISVQIMNQNCNQLSSQIRDQIKHQTTIRAWYQIIFLEQVRDAIKFVESSLGSLRKEW